MRVIKERFESWRQSESALITVVSLALFVDMVSLYYPRFSIVGCLWDSDTDVTQNSSRETGIGFYAHGHIVCFICIWYSE